MFPLNIRIPFNQFQWISDLKIISVEELASSGTVCINVMHPRREKLSQN